MTRFTYRTFLRLLVASAAAYGLSATAQVSVGAAAAASAPGASASANGGTGGVGLGGVGVGVSVNPNVNAGPGEGAQSRAAGNGAISGPRARLNATRDLPLVQEPADRPGNSGQRAIALDEAARARLKK
ncbi:MAG: hypothetical protein V4505_19040 [Pseudomonadota bacterium]